MIQSDIDKLFNDYVKLYTKKYGVKGTTYSDDLKKIARHELGKKFKGIFPSDIYPTPHVANYSYCIVNTDPSHKNGTHWLAVYNTPTAFYIYDSFGRHTNRLVKKFHKRLSGQGKVIDSRHDPEQTDSQTDCGIRSLAFLSCVKDIGVRNAIKI